MEKPYTGKFYQLRETGNYNCSVCDNRIFESESKSFDDSGYATFLYSNENTIVEEDP